MTAVARPTFIRQLWLLFAKELTLEGRAGVRQARVRHHRVDDQLADIERRGGQQRAQQPQSDGGQRQRGARPPHETEQARQVAERAEALAKGGPEGVRHRWSGRSDRPFRPDQSHHRLEGDAPGQAQQQPNRLGDPVQETIRHERVRSATSEVGRLTLRSS